MVVFIPQNFFVVFQFFKKQLFEYILRWYNFLLPKVIFGKNSKKAIKRIIIKNIPFFLFNDKNTISNILLNYDLTEKNKIEWIMINIDILQA